MNRILRYQIMNQKLMKERLNLQIFKNFSLNSCINVFGLYYSLSEWSGNLHLLPAQVKELTYMHSEGIQAGELKHGPLALVDSEVPIIMIVMRDHVFTKCMNALQQVINPSLFITLIGLEILYNSLCPYVCLSVTNSGYFSYLIY